MLVRGRFSLIRHILFFHFYFVSLTETFSGNNGINFPGIRRKSEKHYPALENTFAYIHLPSHEFKQKKNFVSLFVPKSAELFVERKESVGGAYNSHPPIASLN